MKEGGAKLKDLRPRGQGSLAAEQSQPILSKDGIFIFGGGRMDWATHKKSLEGTVLVVDDDLSSRDLLSRFLRLIGCQQIVAMESGEEAIDYLLSNTATLVLLDYRLPGMNGLVALRQMKQIRPNIAVIMVSANPTHEAMLQSIQEGACDMAVKPLDLRNLEKQVMHCFAA